MVQPDAVAICETGGRIFGLRAAVVETVVRATALEPVPVIPAPVAGVVDFHGDVLAVVDMGVRYGEPPRNPLPSDVFVVVRALGGRTVLRVDGVRDVVFPGQDRDSGSADPDDPVRAATFAVPRSVSGALTGVLRIADRLVPVYDPDELLAGNPGIPPDSGFPAAGNGDLSPGDAPGREPV